MVSTFGSGELTLALTEQALGSTLEVDWLRVRTFKGADLCAIGATGVVVGSDFTIIGGESHLFGKCNLAEVFAIGSNITDKLFYSYASVPGWSFSVEMGVATTPVKASAGTLHGVLIETDGTNNVSVQLFNHATDATNPMTPVIQVAGGDRYGGAMGMDCGFSLGCVILLSGANGVATVYYR